MYPFLAFLSSHSIGCGSGHWSVHLLSGVLDKTCAHFIHIYTIKVLYYMYIGVNVMMGHLLGGEE